MVKKDVEVKFSSSTKDFERGINRVIGLMGNMDKNLGELSKSTSNISKVMDRAANLGVDSFGKLGEEFDSVGKEAGRLESNSEDLQDVLGTVGEMKNLGKATSGLGDLGNNIIEVEGKADKSRVGIGNMDLAIDTLGGTSLGVAGIVASSFGSIITTSGKMVTDVMSNLTRLTRGFDEVFTGVANKASSSLNSISGRFSQMGASSGTLMGKVKSLAGAFSVFTLMDRGLSMVTSSVDTAIDRFDTLNNSDLVFKNMGFEVEEVDGMMEKLLGSIEGLPTPLQDSIKDVQLLGATTKDLDRSVDIYSALNNGILGFGGSGEQVTNTIGHLNRAMQKGHIDGTTYNSLMSTMGVAMDTVASEMGHTTESLREGLSEGEISIDSFIDKLIQVNKEGGGNLESLEKIARDATAGIRTSMANLRTAIGRNMTNIMEEIDKVLEDNGLPKMGEMIRNITKEVNRMGDILVSKVEPAFNKLNDIGKDTLVMFAAMPLVLPTVLGILGKMGVGFGKIGEGMSKLPKGKEDMFSKMGEGLGGMLSKIPGINKNLGDMGSKLGLIGKIGDNTIGSMSRAVMTLMGTAMSAVAPTAILGAILVGFGLVNDIYGEEIGVLLEKVRTEWPQLITGIVDGIVSKLPDLINQGVGLVGDILGAINANLPAVLSGGMEIISTLIEGISNNKDELMTSVGEIIRTVSDAIVIYLPEILDMGLGIVLGIGEGILENKEEILNTIRDLIFNLMGVVSENLPAIMELGSGLMQMLIDGLVLIIPDLIQFGLDVLPTMMNSVIENMDIITEGILLVIGTLVGGLIDNMPQILDAGMKILPSLVRGIIDNIAVLLTGALTVITELAKALIENMPAILRVGFAVITELVLGIVRNLPMLMAAGLDLILGLAESILNNLPEIIKTGIELVVSLVIGIIKALPQIVKSVIILMRNFVLTIFKNLPQIAKAGLQIAWSLITGVVKGILSLASSVLNAGKWLWGKVKGLFGKESEEVSEDTTNIFDDMGETLGNTMDDIGESIGGDFGEIKFESVGQMEETKDGVTLQSGQMAEGVIGDYEYMNLESILQTNEMREESLTAIRETREGVSEETETMALEAEGNYKMLKEDSIGTTREIKEEVLRENREMREGVGISYDGIVGDYRRSSEDLFTENKNGFGRINTVATVGSGLVRDTVNREYVGMEGDTERSLEKIRGTTKVGVEGINTEVDTGFGDVGESVGRGWSTATIKQQQEMEAMKESMTIFGKYSQIAMSKSMGMMEGSVSRGSRQVIEAMRNMVQGMIDTLRGLGNRMYIYGANAAIGFNRGLNSRMSQIRATASRMANIVTMTTRRSLDIHSPSRVMEGLGSDTGEGFNKGLSGWVGAVSRTSNSLVSSIGRDIDVGRMVENYSRELRDSQHRVDGTISNHVNGVVRTVDNTTDKKISANIILQTSNGDWKTYVEDITEEQNAMLRRGNY